MKKVIILFLLFPYFLFSQVSPAKIERIADTVTVFGSALSYGTYLVVQSNNRTYKIININGVAATAKLTDLTLNTDYVKEGTLTSVSTAAANNGVTATWSMATPTPALTIGLGAITPTSVNGLTITANGTNTLNIAAGKTLTVPLDASVSGTNTGDNAANTLYSGLVTNATHTGDATGATALTVVGINGTSLAGLATGILKNTTTSGIPSIALAGTDYVAPNGAITGATNTKITYDAKGLVTSATAADLASADFANQGTVTTVLHGNASGNPSFSAIDLITDVTGTLPVGNGGTGSASQTWVDLTTVQGSIAGAKTWTGLGTFSAGMVSSGAEIDLNKNSNFDTYISSGTSTGNVTIGNATGNVGIGGAPNVLYKLTVSGKLKTNAIDETSDQRYKKDIKTVPDALKKVLALRGVNYLWRLDEFPKNNFDTTLQLGVIAQEIEKIVPEVVLTDEKGFKSVEYSKLVALLIEAVKEQEKIIDQQKMDITFLKSDAVRIKKLEADMINLKLLIDTLNKDSKPVKKGK